MQPTYTGFKFLKKKTKGPAMRTSYDWPSKPKPTKKQVLGSVLYGVGVGMSGLGASSAIVAGCANPTKEVRIALTISYCNCQFA